MGNCGCLHQDNATAHISLVFFDHFAINTKHREMTSVAWDRLWLSCALWFCQFVD